MPWDYLLFHSLQELLFLLYLLSKPFFMGTTCDTNNTFLVWACPGPCPLYLLRHQHSPLCLPRPCPLYLPRSSPCLVLFVLFNSLVPVFILDLVFLSVIALVAWRSVAWRGVAWRGVALPSLSLVSEINERKGAHEFSFPIFFILHYFCSPVGR